MSLVAGSRRPAFGEGRPPFRASLALLAALSPLLAPVGCGIACAKGEVNAACATVLLRSSFVRGLVLELCCTLCSWFGTASTRGLSGRWGVFAPSSGEDEPPLSGPSARAVNFGAADWGVAGTGRQTAILGGVAGTGRQTAILGLKMLKWV